MNEPGRNSPISDGVKPDSDADSLVFSRLVKAEAEIEALYEESSFGSHCLGPDGTFSSINSFELSWLGSSREDLIGKRKPRDFLTAESQLKLDHFIRQHGRYGFSHLELDLVDTLEHQHPISMSFNGTHSLDGQPHKSRFVSFDMTAINLNRNLQRIAAISFESMCGMYVTDASGTIIRVNTGFTNLTGYSNQDAIGQHMSFINSGVHDPNFFDIILKSIESIGYWQGETRTQRKDGVLIDEWESLASVKDADGAITNYVGTFFDITANKASQDEVMHLSLHDSLTHLPNRRLLQQRIEHVLELFGRNDHHSALLFVDLDHFKTVNDTLGHEAGDLVLVQASQRMRSVLRDGDTVSRVGGDEFAILLEGLNPIFTDAANQTRLIGEKLLQVLATPYQIKKSEVFCTASIGISMVNPSMTATELLNHADLAMYQAKKNGRNALAFFDPAMQSDFARRANYAQDLQRAIETHEFELYYLPQVNEESRFIGVEAQLRWEHPTMGWLSHNEIIGQAAGCGLLVDLGRWVFRAACHQMKLWQQDESTAKLSMTVKVSTVQFQSPDFVETVLKALESSKADPALLNIAVTEKVLTNTMSATSKMRTLGAAGVKFSLDGFGTGYLSLVHLTHLPISFLNIDQSVVQRISSSQTDHTIVQTIVSMAESLGIGVMADGVETNQQRSTLHSLGCTRYQGPLFGQAITAQTLSKELQRTGS